LRPLACCARGQLPPLPPPLSYATDLGSVLDPDSNTFAGPGSIVMIGANDQELTEDRSGHSHGVDCGGHVQPTSITGCS